MNLFDKFFTKNYQFLKIFIIGLVMLVIITDESFNHYYFHKNPINSIADAILSITITIASVSFAFYIINIKQRQLNDQLTQLTEAYQYIGQINRKIDALLELDISTLDHSKKNSLHESSTAIFKQLVNLLQAKAGLFYLKPPLQFKIYHGDHLNNDIKRSFELLINNGIKEFKFSQGSDNDQYFKDLGINENLLKKYTILIKPVYMHEKDVGHLILLFAKNQILEDRDLNIIRIYSFYLALNYTFKPDMALYQNQLE
ncbi:MAG: hypothetical protein NTX82_03725 [Candidatus Parcubacteria bacterium]|nr:hypothetical protein [Candidatus Parcubacteria bacterium]